MDYTGHENAFIEAASGGAISLGTTTNGSVTERPLPDGRTEVHVRLNTRNAPAWLFQLDLSILPANPFSSTPLLFGARAPDVLAGAEPAVGESLLNLVYIHNGAPGDPLPDLLQVSNFPEPGEEIRSLSFYGRASGPLHALFGVPEGTPGRMEVTQTGRFMASGKGATADGFPAERVHLFSVGR
jgi:hypothetical protein